jgi:hypothetical protein
MVRGLLRFCVGLGSEPDEGARTWPLWPCRSAPRAAIHLIGRVVSLHCQLTHEMPAVGAGLLLGTGLFVPGPPQNRATSRALPDRSPDASQPPLGVTPKLTESRQHLPIDTLRQVWQDRANEWQRTPILPHPRSVKRARQKPNSCQSGTGAAEKSSGAAL